MKRLIKSIFAVSLMLSFSVFVGCPKTPESDTPEITKPDDGNETKPDTTSYTNYDNKITYLEADDYSKFEPAHTVVITLGDEVKAQCDGGKEKTVTLEDDKKMFEVEDPANPDKPLKCQVKIAVDSVENEEAAGIEIENKTSESVKYILKGKYTGTIKIKNKSSDCAVVLNGLKLTSVSGPVFHFTSEEKRTFVVAESGTENNLIDGRVLGVETIYNDKKGSVYAKGPVVFAGVGTINIINTGYKHAVYSADYVRIASGNLNVTVAEETKLGRDCIRALNAFIMDNGKVTLKGYGTINDDESCGIKVEGEDADDPDKKKPKYTFTPGAGFVIINGGELSITTYAKGITAHWKEADSCIDNEKYTDSDTKSVLDGTSLLAADAEKPDPYVQINGGKIEVKTFGEKTEDCNPKGIEAKADLTINGGVVIVSVDSAAKPLDADKSPVINGGVVIANDKVLADGKPKA